MSRRRFGYRYDTLAEKRLDEDEVWVTIQGKLTKLPPDKWPPEWKWPAEKPKVNETEVEKWERVFNAFKVEN
jgi:hypothetical protein